MSLSRRGFLGTLFAAAGALALPRDVLWLPTTETAPILAPEAIVGLAQMTRYLATELSKRGDWTLAYEDQALIGQRVTSDLGHHLAVNQYSYEWPDPPSMMDQFGVDPQRTLDPIVTAFEQRAVQGRHRVFAKLPLPEGAAHSYRVSDGAVSVRGVSLYDVRGDRQRIQFDILLAD